jgi:rare lipoprotein A
MMSMKIRRHAAFLLSALGFLAASENADAAASVSADRVSAPAAHGAKTAHRVDKRKHGIDRSGKPRKGEASYYGKEFAGKTMADGTPMNPRTNNAASKTLPLGTKAEVTNLDNGRHSVVEIRDRGPYVDGRIIDLSPGTASKLGIIEAGKAPVEVAPLELPPPKENESKGKKAENTQP